jgi:cytochrome P450
MIGLIIVVSIAGIVIYFVRKFQKVAEKYKTIPGISLLEFFKDPKNIPIKTAAHANEKFAKIITPVTVFVLATHPDSAKFVLNDPENFPKTTLTTFKKSEKIFSNNIVFANGEQWRQYRNVLSPPFHFDAVKKWIPDFYNLSLELMQQWEKISDKPIDVIHWLPLFTLDVLGVTVLSRNFNAMKGEESEDLEAVNNIIGKPATPKMLIMGAIERKFGLNLNKKINDSIDYIYDSMLDIINARKLKKNDTEHFDLIDVMLNAHDPNWTEKELVSNAFIMFLAGHETTSTALGWMVYHLATLPEIQQKLKEEVDRVLQGKPITQDNIRELVYMSYVIKENLRIQPPVTWVPSRIMKEDTEFEGRMTIPKGARIGMNIYAVHHNPEFWPEPEKFDPERFTKPTVPFSFLPFSLKSRACLGNQFSLVEQTVFLATLMQHFKVSVSSHTPSPSVSAINRVGELKLSLTKLKS